MAEIILAVLCIVAGLACGAASIFIIFANAMGGVTNPSAVNFTPALIFAALAVAGMVGGVALLP